MLPRDLRNNSGQSTMEFLMSMMFALGLVYLFIVLGLNYSAGYLIHYATFMSSRAFLVGDNHLIGAGNGTSVNSVAQRVAQDIFDKFDVKSTGVALTACPAFNHPLTSKYEYVGVSCTWTTKMTLLPFMGGTNKVSMISESFLGRTPSVSDCGVNICHSMTGQASCGGERFKTLFDNGG